MEQTAGHRPSSFGVTPAATSEFARSTPSRIARVLVDSSLPQLDRLFDYRIPEELAADALPGVRVRVPIRSARRIADGFIVELATIGDYPGPLSDLDSVVSPVAVLAPEVWALSRRVAERAAGSASDVLRLAIPKRQVRVEKAWLAAPRVRLTDVSGADIPGYDFSVLPGARYAVDAVPRVTRLASGQWVGDWAVTMAAVARQSVAAGTSAILAVPDYRDQAQLSAALAEVLPPERVVQLDARQPNPDRYRALLRCLGDDALAIVGNRSVIYAPAANLGVIAVWDDGDPLHDEPLSPYVSTRDAALVRQEQQGCALLFFGHSRSTDVERLVELGWLREATPTRSVLPRVVPTAQQQSDDRLAALARIPSPAWRAARDGLERGPVLVQVARPGYAPRLACASCAESARCAHCDGPLFLKTARSAPTCKWCGRIGANWSCPNCAGDRFRLVGQGTGRTAEDLGRAFPGVRVIIADGDHRVLEVGDEPALIIATRGAEPIAAGGYRTLLLLDGERMLARESLRVAEDCLRWWANAIALAAPGALCMLVGVGGPLASALTTWRLASYARGELADRRRLRFPPAVRVATVTGDAESVERALRSIPPMDGADVLGPVEVESGGVRAIVRLDYAEGSAVASALRSALIGNATSRRRRVTTDPRPALPTLKVRFDDTEPFDQ